MKQEFVEFYGTQLLVVNNGNEPMVSLRHLCDGIGVDYKSQWAKVKSNEVLMCGDITIHDTIGRNQSIVCMPISKVNYYLGTINPNRVRSDLKDTLIKYQVECAHVLYAHFSQKQHGGTLDGLTAEVLRDTIRQELQPIHDKLDHQSNALDTTFGDDTREIFELIEALSLKWCVSKREVWAKVREDCDVASYKKTTRKVLNYLRNHLGKGIKLVD